eukprot:1499760-Pyramimonas_sp.AAC.1
MGLLRSPPPERALGVGRGRDRWQRVTTKRAAVRPPLSLSLSFFLVPCAGLGSLTGGAGREA